MSDQNSIMNLMSKVSEQEQILAEKQARLYKLYSHRDAIHRAREQLSFVIERHTERLSRLTVLLNVRTLLESQKDLSMVGYQLSAVRSQNEDFRKSNLHIQSDGESSATARNEIARPPVPVAGAEHFPQVAG